MQTQFLPKDSIRNIRNYCRIRRIVVNHQFIECQTSLSPELCASGNALPKKCLVRPNERRLPVSRGLLQALPHHVKPPQRIPCQPARSPENKLPSFFAK